MLLLTFEQSNSSRVLLLSRATPAEGCAFQQSVLLSRATPAECSWAFQQSVCPIQQSVLSLSRAIPAECCAFQQSVTLSRVSLSAEFHFEQRVSLPAERHFFQQSGVSSSRVPSFFSAAERHFFQQSGVASFQQSVIFEQSVSSETGNCQLTAFFGLVGAINPRLPHTHGNRPGSAEYLTPFKFPRKPGRHALRRTTRASTATCPASQREQGCLPVLDQSKRPIHQHPPQRQSNAPTCSADTQG